MNKLLFLDIDGVLNTNMNTFQQHRPRELMIKEFNPVAITNLSSVIRETHCKIVISSSWRINASIDDFKKWFSVTPDIASAIVDFTPVMENCQRGEEILNWLIENAYEGTFAVLDDGNDMDAVRPHFFQTRKEVGLDNDITHKIQMHLNNQKNYWK